MKKLLAIKDRFIARVKVLITYMALTSSFLVMVIMLITVADVGTRAILGRPIGGVTELTTLLLVVVAFLGFAYVQLIKQHIALSLFVERFSPRLAAIQAILVNGIYIFIFCLIMYFGIEAAKHSYLIQEHEVGVRVFIPVWTIRIFVPIGSFFVVLLSVIELIEGITNLVRRR